MVTYKEAIEKTKEKKERKASEPNWMRDSYKRGMAKKMSSKKKYIKEASFEAESKLYK